MTMAHNKQTIEKNFTNLENDQNILWRNCKCFINICNERKARAEALNFSLLDLDESSSWNSLSILEKRNFSESVLMSFCVKVGQMIVQLAEYDYLFFHHIKIKYFSTLASLRDWFWLRLTKVYEPLDSVLIDFIFMEERVGVLYRKYMHSRFQLWNIVNDVRVELAKSMHNNNSSAFISSDDVMYKLLNITNKMEKFQKHYLDWYKELEIRLETINWNMDNTSTTVKEVEEKIDAFEMSLCSNQSENSVSKKKSHKKKNRRRKNYDSDDNNTSKNHDHDLKQIPGPESSNYEETTIMNKYHEFPTTTTTSKVPIFQPSLETSKEFRPASVSSPSSSFSASVTEVNPSSMGINHAMAHETKLNATENSTKTLTDLPRSGLFTKYADNKNSSQVMRKIRDLFNSLNWSETSSSSPDINDETIHTTNI